MGASVWYDVHRTIPDMVSVPRSVALAATDGMLGTATTLRRRFHRTIGVPPDAYHRTFRT
jgi:hypothetical protein